MVFTCHICTLRSTSGTHCQACRTRFPSVEPNAFNEELNELEKNKSFILSIYDDEVSEILETVAIAIDLADWLCRLRQHQPNSLETYLVFEQFISWKKRHGWW